MDGPDFTDAEYPIASNNAVTFLYEKIMKCDQKVILVALAPLTNLALLLKVFPQVKENIECITLMGGGISHGNCTEMAEFNIYVDPDAAHIVFQSGIPIVMSGLDVTEKAAITQEEIASLSWGGKVSRLAYELLRYYHESGKQFGFVDSPIHDLCAIEYLLEPEIFQGERLFVDVVTDSGTARGLTYAERRLATEHKKNTLVLTDVNREKFVRILVDALRRLDQQVR